MNTLKTRNDLAEVLLQMTFGELFQVAYELVDMNVDKETRRNVGTPMGMAQTLHDWAEAQ